MKTQNILIRPIITEKSMNDVSKNRFTFEVAIEADKKAVKREIEKRFKVNVLSVLTSIMKGKRKRSGIRRIEKIVLPFKKATVCLKAGQKIDLFEAGT